MPEDKILLKNCGIIDPGNIETYLNQGGFEALAKAREFKRGVGNASPGARPDPLDIELARRFGTDVKNGGTEAKPPSA